MRTCVVCGDTFSNKDIRELLKMGETVWVEGKDKCICPDCFERLESLDPSERLRVNTALYGVCSYTRRTKQ